MVDVDGLRSLASKLSCEDQFRLATFIAGNVGYVLVPEPDYENPTLEERIARLEKAVDILLPNW